MSNQSSKSFLLTFWYRPASSMRQLLDSRKGHTVAIAVAVIFCMLQFSRSLPRKSEDILLHFLLCGLGGIVSLFLFGWLIRNFGRWFGADAEQRRVRTALGLGILPWTILFTFLFLMLNYGLNPKLIETQYFPVFLGAFVYGFCILLLSLTAALRVGVIKTFLCIVVTILFSVFPLTLLAQVLAHYLK
ncbi:MAG: hypothetical protein ACJAYS_000481 [Lentimonas sp.]|jgi:hypothetical protein